MDKNISKPLSFAEIEKDFASLKNQSLAAVQTAASCDDKEEMMESFSKSMNYLWDYVYKMNDRIYSEMYKYSDVVYQHAQNGHLPQLTPSALAKLLSVAGMDEDYEIRKKTIFASDDSKLAVKATKNGLQFNVSFNKK